MKLFHEGQGKALEVGPGDIVRAIGPTKSVDVGRVVGVATDARGEHAIVSWFGVGTGSGWRATDLELIQTREERAELLAVGVNRFLSGDRRAVDAIAGTSLNPRELGAVKAIAKDLRVRFIDLVRAVRTAVEYEANPPKHAAQNQEVTSC